MNPRALVVASLAVVALVGLAIAAEGQEESFLKPSEIEAGFDDRSIVSGSLVVLTAGLVAAAGTAMAALLARVPVRQRLLPLAAVFVGIYIVVAMVQSAMFNYNAIDVARAANFSITLLLANESAAASIYVGPIVVVLGAGLAIQAGAQRLGGRARAPQDPDAALSAFLGAVALALPALVVAAVGSIRVLLALPSQDPDTLPYLLLIPMGALAAVSLGVLAGIKAWHLGIVARDRRMAPVAREVWEGVRRAEWAAVGALIALALLAALLPAVQDPVLEAGRVFGVTARSHTQAFALLVILLVPSFTLHKPLLARMQGGWGGPGLTGPHPQVVGFFVAGGAGLAGALVGTLLLEGALWPWLFCMIPLAVFALKALAPGDGLLPALATALVLWAIGNTVAGSFQLQTNSQLRYDVSPGMLALWRALAILVVAWAVARATRARTQGMRQAIAWPLAMGTAASIGLIVFFELSLSAWIIRDGAAEYVGIGTLMASLDPPVRGVLHTMGGIGAFLSGLAIARLERPEWFGRSAAAPAPLPPLPAEA